MLISSYKNIHDSQDTDIELDTFLEGVQLGKWQDIALDVRNAPTKEIKALKKEIEELKKQLVKKQDPIDIISSEEEIIFNKPLIVKEDPYNVIIQELKDQEEWMADFVRQTKPKKKSKKESDL